MPALRFPGLRPLVAAMLIAQHLAIGLGVRLPARAAATPSAERYPCENCPCGCHSAAQCWRHCCCMSNEQKIAWARANGVPVPDFVLAAAAREKAAPHPGKCSHCARKAATARPAPPGVCLLSALRCKGLIDAWQEMGPMGECARSGESSVLRPSGRVAPKRCGATHPCWPPAPPTPPPRIG